MNNPLYKVQIERSEKGCVLSIQGIRQEIRYSLKQERAGQIAMRVKQMFNEGKTLNDICSYVNSQ